ncbi:MAG TPA: family 10 glycosylhydrolase [Kiritimatiellia bacterium]|nr:family 10 glycosylhydrolase [Kiritimatiellia bacterium]HPS08638.1 family 10 glycosylhydrolase [Kiritimatiellia bacterium]
MKRSLIMFAAGMLSVLAWAAPVAVIQGSEAVAAGERRFALALARHVERWYREAGVEAALTDDTDLTKALADKKVAVLVYLSQPTASQMAALTAFSRRGGKLIVCYSSSPALASLLGVQTVGYQKGSTDGRWSQMRFAETRPRGVPDVILQTSQNLFLVQPVPGRSQVLAWWHDRQGRQTAEAAWLASSSGYWMTHVLLADGDAEAKGRLLLALAAAHDPALWQPAAARMLQQARQVGGVGGVSGMVTLAGKAADPARRSRAVPAAQAARQKDLEAAQLLSAGKGYEAWLAANDLKARMYEVYGMVQSARRGEIRAVWDHSGMGLYPGDWPRTCRLLKDAGFSDLYVNVAGAAFAHYASGVLPRSRVFDEQGDQLAACLAAAKPLGLRVHAWLLCFSAEGATPERLAIFRKRGWLLTNGEGAPLNWLDPAVPEIRPYLVSAVREMAVNYKTDGVHLDFVRYPDYASSLGPAVKLRFEKATGRRAADWPEDVKSGALRAQFIRWRSDQISDFVQAARKTVRREAPGKLLTAAVFGKYPSCLDAVGQDWESWTNIGLVDYVVPMNYTEELAKFNEWLGQQTRTRKQTMKVVPGIGVTAAESRLDAAQVIDQIQSARRAGCPGFALFDLDTTLRQEILPVLRMGVTAP